MPTNRKLSPNAAGRWQENGLWRVLTPITSPAGERFTLTMSETTKQRDPARYVGQLVRDGQLVAEQTGATTWDLERWARSEVEQIDAAPAAAPLRRAA